MEENNFEKQVQEKLGDLVLPPSPDVWNNIAKRIEKKNDRKWLFFLFFGIALLLVTGTWFYNLKRSKSFEHFAAVPKIDKVLKNSISKNKIDSTQITNPIDVKIKEPEKENGIIESNKVKNNGVISSENSVPVSTVISKEELYHKRKPFKTETPVRNYTRITNADQVAFSENYRGVNSELSFQFIVDHFLQNAILPYNPEILSDSFISKRIENTDSVISKQTKTQSNWQCGFKLNVGYSGLTSSLAPMANYASYAVVSNGYTGAYNIVYPAHITSGPGFIVGIVAEKKMAGRSSFFTGLNFKHFATSISVGNHNDTNNTYSASGLLHNYTNRMNFLELPVGIRVPLNKSNNTPAFFKGGMALSQLINSNALQFNGNGVYFIDNKYFNKTQVNLNAGFSLGYYTKRNDLISFGPIVNFDINPISSSGNYNGKHLFFVGLDASVLFHKVKH